MKYDESRDMEVALRLEKRIAEYESQLQQKRSADVKRGMAIRAERGQHISRIPIGYIRFWRDGEFFITADPIQAPLVHQAFHIAATGRYSVRELQSEMLAKGLRHSDGRPPSSSGVYRMLANPFYMGIVRIGGVDFPGNHPAIVSREAFEKAKFTTNSAKKSVLL